MSLPSRSCFGQDANTPRKHTLTPLPLLLQAPAGSPAPAACAVLSGAGPLNVRGSLSGSHLAPATRVDWAAPASSVTGSAQFSPSALSVAVTGGSFSLRASAAVSNPSMDQARNANTQVWFRGGCKKHQGDANCRAVNNTTRLVWYFCLLFFMTSAV